MEYTNEHPLSQQSRKDALTPFRKPNKLRDISALIVKLECIKLNAHTERKFKPLITKSVAFGIISLI